MIYQCEVVQISLACGHVHGGLFFLKKNYYTDWYGKVQPTLDSTISCAGLWAEWKAEGELALASMHQFLSVISWTNGVINSFRSCLSFSAMVDSNLEL